MSFLKEIFSIFPKKERLHLSYILFLIISSTALETIGTGLLFPFLEVVSNPKGYLEKDSLQNLLPTFGIHTEENLILITGLILIFFTIGKNIFFSYSLYFREIYLQRRRTLLVGNLFNYYLNKDFLFHVEKNSATLYRNLNQADALFTSFIQPTFNLISDGLIISFLLGLMFYSEPQVTLLALGLLGIPSLIINRAFSKKYKKIG
ncbi:MAG: hypothetical protein NXH75_00430, partial [Halobacteriovoraceae bacterium]|nr:hypothetical protein [Halobacteriovoraceae bacterium]